MIKSELSVRETKELLKSVAADIHDNIQEEKSPEELLKNVKQSRSFRNNNEDSEEDRP